MWNLFKVNNKDTRTTSLRPDFTHFFWYSHCWLWVSKYGLGRKYFRFQSLENYFFSIECSSIGPGVGKAGSDKVIQTFLFSVKESILPNLFETSSSEKIHYFKPPSEGWVFVYELSGCGFESRCSHLNFRFRARSEQGVPWHSGNYRVWIRSDTRTWHDNNIKSFSVKLQIFYLCFN